MATSSCSVGALHSLEDGPQRLRLLVQFLAWHCKLCQLLLILSRVLLLVVQLLLLLVLLPRFSAVLRLRERM
jgi:hypothetical protein